MSLNKNQLNIFFKYYENIKLREAKPTVNTTSKNTVFPIFFGNHNLENEKETIINTLKYEFESFLNKNSIWNERSYWFNPFSSKSIDLVENPSIKNTFYLKVFINDKLTNDILYNIKNNSKDNLKNYFLSKQISYENPFLEKPYILFGFVTGNSSVKSYIDYDIFNKNLNNKKNYSEIFSELKDSAGKNIAFINYLSIHYGSNPNLYPNTINKNTENLSNYNTFTVMQINAAQKAIENFATKNSKTIKSTLIELVPGASQHENLFAVNFICQQNNLTEKNKIINKEILKEGQKMGTLFSRSTSEDKNTNLAEINFDITLQLLPSKNYDKLKDDEKKNINISFTKDANLLKNAENTLKAFKDTFIKGLNNNKALNKITYKDSVFYLKYKNEGDDLKIIPENTIKFSIKVYKTASRNSATAVAGKIIQAL